MKTPTLAAALVLFLPIAHAEPESQPSSADKQPAAALDSARLKTLLIESLRADIKAAEGVEGSDRTKYLLTQELTKLLNDPVQGREITQAMRTSESNLRMGNASEKTLSRFQDHMRQAVKDEALAARKAADEAVGSARAELRKAMGATTPDEVAGATETVLRISQQMERRSNETGDLYNQLYQLKSTLESIGRFHAYRESDNLSEAQSQVGQISQSLRKLPRFIASAEVQSYEESLRKQLGLPAPSELGKLLQDSIDELFNDANQDRLDEIVERIRRTHNLLGNASSSIYRGKDATPRWQTLSSMANEFNMNVRRVRNGGIPQFTASRWAEGESGSKPLMPVKDLLNRLRNYKVRMDDGKGGITFQPMAYDTMEILGRIRTLSDLSKELPELKMAVRCQGSQSENGEINQAYASLEYLANLAAKLDTGEAFQLAPESNGYGDSRRYVQVPDEHPASARLKELSAELHLKILRRFFPGIPADEKSPPARILRDLLEKEKSKGRFDQIPTLNQLAQFITPGQPLLLPRDLMAIQFYLSGLRQSEVFSEPRLATFYFQKAAAMGSDILPVSELKTRLKRLKSEFPADYEQGTDDLFKPGSDDFANRHAASGTSGTLVIPATNPIP